MAGVRLEFAQFGHFDYFNIYRNPVSTDKENLGQPIGTSSTMYFEDFNAEPNLDYFYRVGVVNGQAELISDEIYIRTEVMFNPPYNLIIEFKKDETNRLELNWNLDGLIDEQRYYCSETPIDPDNLPLPKAILSGDVRSYIDTSIDYGKTYYLQLSSVKNSIEKLSTAVEKYAGTGDKYWDKVAVLMHFNSGSGSTTSFYEEKNQIFLPRLGSTYVESGGRFNDGVFYGRNGARAIQIPAAYYKLGNSDFTIELSVKFTQLNAGTFYDLLGQRGSYTANQSYAFYYYTGSGKWNLEYSSNGTSTSYVSFDFIPVINTWYDLQLVRYGDTLELRVNGISKGTATLPAGFNFFESTAQHQLALSAEHVASATQTHPTWFDEFRVTIGVARPAKVLIEEFKNFI